MGLTQSHNKITPETLEKSNPVHKQKIKFVLGIIDPQNDMIEGGALAVPKSHRILAPINKLRFMTWDYMNVFITQNVYPTNHVRFCTTHNNKPFEKNLVNIKYQDNTDAIILQEILPPHCIEKTP